METLHYIGLLVVSILLIIIQQYIRRNNKTQHRNLPPSPPGLPVIGHFHLLKKPVAQTLNNLCNKYGPILLLHLGSRPTLVVSSRSAIEECLTKNDIVFANRPILQSTKDEDTSTSIGGPYGDHWRNLRRAYALEIFSPRRLLLSVNIRTEEIRFMAKHLFVQSSFKEVQKVDLKSLLYKLDFNIVMRMFAGKRCFEQDEMGTDVSKGKLDELNQTFTPVMPMALGDYFPFLRWLTLYGAEQKIRKIQRKRDDFVQALIDDHRNTHYSSGTRITGGSKDGHCLIDALLKLQESEPEFYTDKMIQETALVMLIAGPHTTVMAMEIVVSRLASHPEVFKTARDEIDKHVGQSRLIEDADLAKLLYIHCVMNETLRLDSLVRILPAHESSKECTVGGYNIPAGTQLLINAGAVHMDPELWENPDEFNPERFLRNEEEEERGGCKFLPFGSGRRQCPGSGFAMRLMALSLGTLIQCFDWEKAEEIPLKIIFRPREDLRKVLAQL